MTGSVQSSDGRDNLSTVSTILGLILFILLVVSILIRRFVLARRIRAIYEQRVHRTNTLYYNRAQDGIGLSTDSNEPRTIALGARADLWRKPRLYEERIHSIPDDEKQFASLGDMQPISLQLTTPHTTSQFPTKPKPKPTRPPHRSFIFRSHSQDAPPLADDDRPPESAESPTEPKLDHAHPLLLSFIISMPDASNPTFHPIRTRGILSNVEVGIISPCVTLPSMSVKQEELESWWNHSSSPLGPSTTNLRLPTSTPITTLYTTAEERRDAERMLQLHPELLRQLRGYGYGYARR